MLINWFCVWNGTLVHSLHQVFQIAGDIVHCTKIGLDTKIPNHICIYIYNYRFKHINIGCFRNSGSNQKGRTLPTKIFNLIGISLLFSSYKHSDHFSENRNFHPKKILQ